MKKIYSILLAMALALSLCACAGVELPPLPEVTDRPEATEAPDGQIPEQKEPDPTAPVVEQGSAAAPSALNSAILVSFQNTTREAYDPEEGTQLILNFSYDTPVIRMEDRPEAASRINQAIAMLDESFYTGKEYGDGGSGGYNYMLMLAEDNYTYVRDSGSDLPLEYSCTRGARVTRVDQKVFNPVFSYSQYTGGAHGNYSDESYVFDTESGERLRLEDLTSDYEGLKSFLVDWMLDKAVNDPDIADCIYPDTDEQTLREQLTALLRDGSWYLDDKSLTVFPTLYEIGPYAAGIIEFKVPYEQLRGRIDDVWFPVPAETDGSISVMPLEELGNGTTEILDRIVANESGTELALVVRGTVSDVRLSGVYYEDFTDSFYELSQIWLCTKLSDCAVQLVSVVPEGLPNLMISYRGENGEVQNKLLTQSGLDGRFLLIDDNIAPVG